MADSYTVLGVSPPPVVGSKDYSNKSAFLSKSLLKKGFRRLTSEITIYF